MEDELELTRAQLAQRIGFSAAVLRKWERDFAEFVTSPAGVKGLAKARVYNLEDVILFGTIAQLRTEGLSLDAIRAKLPERLAQARAQLDEGVATAPVSYTHLKSFACRPAAGDVLSYVALSMRGRER